MGGGGVETTVFVWPEKLGSRCNWAVDYCMLPVH